MTLPLVTGFYIILISDSGSSGFLSRITLRSSPTGTLSVRSSGRYLVIILTQAATPTSILIIHFTK